MFFLYLLRYALLILVPTCALLSSYLYLYPLFHFCAFPSPEQSTRTAYFNTLRGHTPFAPRNASLKIAPFRLLALGDPQLEGESSIHDADATNFPHLSKFWNDALLRDGTVHSPLQRLRHSLHDLIDFYLDDIPKALAVYRKRLDLIGNDYYLGHIYRTMHWWTGPTHVTILGDLVGSQWIDDAEFEVRRWRYWNRVFHGGVLVPEEVEWLSSGDDDALVLGEDSAAWKRRVINVAGNHDVGYAGDLTKERLERFTKAYGKPNYELRFQMPVAFAKGEENEEEEGFGERPVPELRIVVFNDMNLDTPAGSQEMQQETYGFLNHVITSSEDVARPAHFTILLTHIPMYKDAGICVDGPFFDFYTDQFGNGVKEQNHLSRDASKGILEGIFGMSGNPDAAGGGFGRNGVILTGHDHEGCSVYHYINQSSPPEERQWEATTWLKARADRLHEQPDLPGLREITVRSMMGDFAGNAGLMSLWFDEKTWNWRFEFANCALGAQHIWWVVHILDLVAVGVALVYGVIVITQRMMRSVDSKDGKLSNGTAKPSKSGHANGDMAKANGATDTRPTLAGVSKGVAEMSLNS